MYCDNVTGNEPEASEPEVTMYCDNVIGSEPEVSEPEVTLDYDIG